MESKAELNRVGILLIHGIGEQSQFEHLEEVVRNVATALDADQKIESFTVCVNSSKDSAYRARQQIWKGGEIATAFIDVQGPPGTPLTRLEFREVWWADLDEPSSLKTALSFWGWALSLWSQAFESKRIHNVPQPKCRPTSKYGVTPKYGAAATFGASWNDASHSTVFVPCFIGGVASVPPALACR